MGIQQPIDPQGLLNWNDKNNQNYRLIISDPANPPPHLSRVPGPNHSALVPVRGRQAPA